MEVLNIVVLGRGWCIYEERTVAAYVAEQILYEVKLYLESSSSMKKTA